MIRKFELVRDVQGYPMAIAVHGRFVIHLERGSTRNVENAAKVVELLNTAVALFHKDCGTKALRTELKDCQTCPLNECEAMLKHVEATLDAVTARDSAKIAYLEKKLEETENKMTRQG